ncbi:MAG: QueT transporter family protein [Clostridiales bacterium]|nr:QueT transporter family protein [Clostridiales bacterium]
MKSNAKKITIMAIVAAIYVVLTVTLSGLSYGGIQFRIAEALMLLCFYKKEYCVALSAGCFISNLFSPMPIDMVVGTVATILAALAMYLIGKTEKAGTDFTKKSSTVKLIIASLMPVISNGIIVGLELGWLYGEIATYIYMLQVAFGEFVCVTILGVALFKALEKNKGFMKLICFEEVSGKNYL